MEAKNYSEEIFENLKHINEYGQEFWYARELQPALEYSQWRRFADAIERAKIACEKSGHSVSEHFAGAGKSLPMPKGGERIVDDFALSRYACYLTHFEVGKKVRQTIAELGGTMSEDLPTPDKSVRQLEKEHEQKVLTKDDEN